MARQYKILYFSQAPWTIGEREADRDKRVKANEAVALKDLYPNSHPGRVISIIDAAKSFSEGDLKDPTRSVITLSLTEKGRNALASRETYIKAGKTAPTTFDTRWGHLAEVLRANFDDVLTAEREAEKPPEDPAAFELTDGWRFAELAALNQKMLPKTEVHSGAGLYPVGPGLTYSTIQSALDQLWTDQGSDTFTVSQYIRVFAGIYDENVVPNAGLAPVYGRLALIIEGNPADNRDNIVIAPSSGDGFNCNGPDYVTLRHLKVAPVGGTYAVDFGSGSYQSTVKDVHIVCACTYGIRLGRMGTVEGCYIEQNSNNTACYGVFARDGFIVETRARNANASRKGTGFSVAEGPVQSCYAAGYQRGVWVTDNGLVHTILPVDQVTLYDCDDGIYTVGTAGGRRLRVTNTIISGCTDCLHLDEHPQETATQIGWPLTLRNNCFHNYTNFANDGSTTKTQAQINALNRVDSADNLGGDPLLTDPNSGDFSLQAASICRRAGHGSGVVKDYLGTVFHTAHPDIGAWSSGNRNSSAASGTIVDDETGTSLTVTVDANNNTLDETWAYYSADDGLTWTLFPTSVTGDGDIQITGLSTWREYRVQLVTSRNGAPGNEGAQGSCLSMTVTDGTSRSWEVVCNTIRTRFKTEIVDSISGGLPTMYDNDGAFDKPEDGRWCRFSIRPADSEQVEMGDLRRYRTPGVAIAQVFVPVGKGDKDALVVADAIKTAFRSVTVSGVKFKTPSLQVMGREGDKWQVNVTIPFYVDEVI